MRNIRKAAIAATTAFALTLGATTAVADEANNSSTKPATVTDDGANDTSVDPNNPNVETKNTDSLINDLSSNAPGSSEWGDRYDADKVVTGNDLLGSTKNWENQPEWSKIWYGVTVAGVLASVLGLVVFPALNKLLNIHNT